MPQPSSSNQPLIVQESGGDGKWLFHCPGCGCGHWVRFDPALQPCWTWNGDPVRPTISPSILTSEETLDGQVISRCHSYVEGGNIRFLSDCTHALAGQTVPLEPI